MKRTDKKTCRAGVPVGRKEAGESSDEVYASSVRHRLGESVDFGCGRYHLHGVPKPIYGTLARSQRTGMPG